MDQIRKLNLEVGNCHSCANFREWSENQAPLGSGYYWPEQFTDCIADVELIEKEDGDFLPGEIGICSSWERIPVQVCQIHNAEYIEFCEECLKDEEESRIIEEHLI